MEYIISTELNKDESIILIKDSTTHFSQRVISSVKTKTIEELKKQILPYISEIIEYYKELCSSQDEAN